MHTSYAGQALPGPPTITSISWGGECLLELTQGRCNNAYRAIRVNRLHSTPYAMLTGCSGVGGRVLAGHGREFVATI